jgi:hypothetical protein
VRIQINYKLTPLQPAGRSSGATQPFATELAKVGNPTQSRQSRLAPRTAEMRPIPAVRGTAIEP